jgi:hypothetical protein
MRDITLLAWLCTERGRNRERIKGAGKTVVGERSREQQGLERAGEEQN